MTIATQPTSQTTRESIDLWSAKSMKVMNDDWPRLRCRFINADPVGRWEDFRLSEWELEACGWEDFHPHSETNYLVEGELYIESEGTTVILRPGDSARVNPGQLGRYWAPVYARMVTVYGPNPDGAESHSFRYFEI
ncbi:cupin domain-containing protein [Pseudarthrobacter sulfonivorans]|uniref:cupin domain-containing protein n=1 Tax=Pseudarthrobacter sulfonivorans TaxID=121292 RepID=UPI002786AAA3|nr:cupin domain-containing protein [Pseudarthrobacter sulfonivorans]MDP9998243.1 putative cupin superfamily protein [Pseudarthrobacter sulfonivorans]